MEVRRTKALEGHVAYIDAKLAAKEQCSWQIDKGRSP